MGCAYSGGQIENKTTFSDICLLFLICFFPSLCCCGVQMRDLCGHVLYAIKCCQNVKKKLNYMLEDTGLRSLPDTHQLCNFRKVFLPLWIVLSFLDKKGSIYIEPRQSSSLLSCQAHNVKHNYCHCMKLFFTVWRQLFTVNVFYVLTVLISFIYPTYLRNIYYLK